MCDGFHDISCNQHLETKQERSANTDLVYLGILPTHWPPEMQIGGPSDSDDDDKHAEHLSPAPDHTDGLIGYRFDSLKSDRIIHIGVPVMHELGHEQIR